MFFVIKKSQIIMAGFVAFALVFSYAIYNFASPSDKEPKKVKTDVIVIDPGHGGMDGGAVGNSGTLEKDINLKVSLFLKEIAENNGKKVIMTRDSDVSLDSSGSKTVRVQKRSDLENRRKILNENKDSVFISIHMNKFEQPNVRGAQVFYANNDQSRVLAQNIQTSLISGIGDGNERVAKPAPENLYIFKGCESTAVVVECGFLSNSEEEKSLNSEEYQKKLAGFIYSGIFK